MNNEFSIATIFNNILITGVVYGLIFCSVIFFSKKRKGKPIFYLFLIVLFISLNNLQAWLIDMQIISSYNFIKYFKIPWYFFCMPLFYVFLIHYLKIQKKAQSFLTLTYGLFILAVLGRLTLIFYGQFTGMSDLKLRGLIANYTTFEEIISFLYTVGIFIYPIPLFSKNRKMFESVLIYDDLKWIKHFFIVGAVIIITWLIAIIQNFQDQSLSSPDIYYPLRLSTSILIYWVGFKGLFRYRVMEDRIVLRENFKKEVQLKKVTLNLSDEIFEQDITTKSAKQRDVVEKINSYVVDNKKYLDPYISLDTLANELRLSSGHLSFLINNYYNFSFSDYINKLRVAQVKESIIEQEYVNYTIVAIGLESGFNSKSTFYTAFKKFTNLSPVQFKKQFSA